MLVLMDESLTISFMNPFTQEQLELLPTDEQLALASGRYVMMV